jgi:ABC-type branched-subunit amino acid transport system ATPase component
MTVLAIANVSVSYGKVEAVRGVSLEIGHGQIVTVIGPNGAGKTTLMLATMGLSPLRGRVIFSRASTPRAITVLSAGMVLLRRPRILPRPATRAGSG